MMVEWIVKASLRAYPDVEKAKIKAVKRFSAPIEANDEHLRQFLISTGKIPFEDVEDEEYRKAT